MSRGQQALLAAGALALGIWVGLWAGLATRAKPRDAASSPGTRTPGPG